MKKNELLIRARNAFVKQQDQTHCGAACLSSLVKWFGGRSRLEWLAEQSGTDAGGANFLGLKAAAIAAGIEAEGYEADIENLRTAESPSMLHVLKPGNLQHFVMCYGWREGMFLISDPAEEVRWMSEKELDSIWQSKKLLLFDVTPAFKTSEAESKEKRQWLLSLLKPDYNILGVALAIGIAITFLSMAPAVFVQRLLDDILPNQQTAKLGVGLSLLVFLMVIRAGLGLLRTKFLLRQSRDFNNRIVGQFFGALLHLPKSFFDNRRTGDLIARLNDTLRIQNAVSYLSTNLMIDVLLTLMCLAFIFMYSPWLFLIACSILPLFFFVSRLFHQPVLQSQRDLMAAYARNESHYVDTIQGIWPIKAGNREKYFSSLSRLIYDFFQERVLRLGEVSMRFNFLAEISSSLILAGILTTGALLQLNGVLETGGFIAVVYLIQMMIPAAGRLAVVNIQLQEARVAFDRMYEFASLQPEYDEATDNTKIKVNQFDALEINQISFGFPGKSTILDSVSIEVRKGECCALFGESGSGKSTLLQILQKFYSNTSGEIKLNGQPWDAISFQSWRDLIGVVPQQIRIFSGTLAENISLDDPQTDPEAWVDFMKEYGFDKYFLSFPQGLNTRLGEGGINLSGGQQQLVAIARALYRKPQLLLLDESTSAMDRNTEDFVIHLIEKIKSKCAVLMISHRIRSVKNCDRIFVLKDGKTEVHGTHDELVQGDNLYALSWRDYTA
jgi:ATP-binding cassette, subfamily C, bacteriocin exporter